MFAAQKKGNNSSNLLDAFTSGIERTTLNHMQKSKAMKTKEKDQVLHKKVIIRDGLVIINTHTCLWKWSELQELKVRRKLPFTIIIRHCV